MPTLIIDGKEISVKAGSTVMEAARKLGVAIPHFCYHPKLPVAGNCRMCLIEVEKVPKPVIACAQPVSDGMVVRTDSPMVVEARKAVMEFLLINHPLDCPVCDQGGECDLQDLAMKCGPDRSRFHDQKRHAVDRDLGPIIETVMTRCIHCTRCIRFSTEIAGVEEMGATFRGDHMAVGTYVEKTLTSELAGNLAQTCPVGALNLKPFHFQARGWELKSARGVCNHCPVGCHVDRDHLDGTVKRVMAARCDAINDMWICDKGRFSYDGLTVGRLKTPMVRRNSLSPTPVSWQEALDRAAELLKGVKPEEVAGLAAADRQGAEELYAFQDLLRNAVGTPHVDHRLRQRDFSGDQAELTRADLLLNTPMVRLTEADLVLVIGADTRYEVPLLNLRLRQAAQQGCQVVAINPRRTQGNIPGLREILVAPGGERVFLAGLLNGLEGAAAGEHAELATALKGAARPVILLGQHATNHPEAEQLRRQAVAIAQASGGLTAEWNGFNRLTPYSNAAAAQDLGVVPHRAPGYRLTERPGRNALEILRGAADGSIKVLFLLGADPVVDGVDTALARRALEKATVIYLGATDGQASQVADVILPGATIAEKDATLTNCEGRVQRSRQAVPPPGEAKEDWRVLRSLSDRFATSLPYNTLEALRAAMAAADHRYNLAGLGGGELPDPCDHSPVTTGLDIATAVSATTGAAGLTLLLEPAFYADDAVCRRSKTLGQLDPGAVLRINPQDAAASNIGDGQSLRVVRGERIVEAVAALDDRLPQGVVSGGYGGSDTPLQNLVDADGGYPVVGLAGL